MLPPQPAGPDLRVVCSMHRLFGKGYAGGGERQRLGADVFVVASSKSDASRTSNLVTGSRSSSEEHVKLESLILAQNERWRQA